MRSPMRRDRRRFKATLEDVLAHYDRVRELHLSPGQRAELVEYLKTL